MPDDRDPSDAASSPRGVELPVFPLHAVLYPGGPLSLRIFEPRYLDMVSDCLRADRPFAVCLIREGQEAGRAALPHPVGTLARIVDWSQHDDGLLGIVAAGESRVRLGATRVTEAELVVAEVEPLPEPPAAAVPGRLGVLVDLAKGLVERAGSLYDDAPKRFGDASWVGYRLAEILPLPLERKQQLLETDDPLARLEQLAALVRAMAEREA